MIADHDPAAQELGVGLPVVAVDLVDQRRPQQLDQPGQAARPSSLEVGAWSADPGGRRPRPSLLAALSRSPRSCSPRPLGQRQPHRVVVAHQLARARRRGSSRPDHHLVAHRVDQVAGGRQVDVGDQRQPQRRQPRGQQRDGQDRQRCGRSGSAAARRIMSTYAAPPVRRPRRPGRRPRRVQHPDQVADDVGAGRSAGSWCSPSAASTMAGRWSTSWRVISQEMPPWPIDDRRPQHGHRHPAAAEQLLDLAPGPQVRRQLVVVVAEAAEVDDPLARPASAAACAERPGRLGVLLLEVVGVQGVHQVVGGVACPPAPRAGCPGRRRRRRPARRRRRSVSGCRVIARTECPASTRAGNRWEPTKPDAPVTRHGTTQEVPPLEAGTRRERGTRIPVCVKAPTGVRPR